jgi:hypothetical protein
VTLQVLAYAVGVEVLAFGGLLVASLRRPEDSETPEFRRGRHGAEIRLWSIWFMMAACVAFFHDASAAVWTLGGAAVFWPILAWMNMRDAQRWRLSVPDACVVSQGQVYRLPGPEAYTSDKARWLAAMEEADSLVSLEDADLLHQFALLNGKIEAEAYEERGRRQLALRPTCVHARTTEFEQVHPGSHPDHPSDWHRECLDCGGSLPVRCKCGHALSQVLVAIDPLYDGYEYKWTCRRCDGEAVLHEQWLLHRDPVAASVPANVAAPELGLHLAAPCLHLRRRRWPDLGKGQSETVVPSSICLDCGKDVTGTCGRCGERLAPDELPLPVPGSPSTAFCRRCTNAYDCAGRDEYKTGYR